MITDVDATPLEVTKNLIFEGGGTAVARVLDLSDKAAVDAIITKVVTEEAGLDYCINNARIQGVIVPLHTVNPSDWKRTIDVNLSYILY